MITYSDSLDSVAAKKLSGFFNGWPNPPTPETHLRLLHQSDLVILAVDQVLGEVVGFITALTDGMLSAYISFLEVRPAYQRQGIGSELVRRMLKKLSEIYAVDITCDPSLSAFYGRFGLRPYHVMISRNYALQSGQ